MTQSLLTQSEYARHRGCDEATVRRAVREGRITTAQRLPNGRVLIDAQAADAQWAQNTRERADSAPAPASDYKALRVRRERALVSRIERENDEAEGLLVQKAEAARAAFDALRALRDAVMGTAPRLAPRVCGMDDVRAIEQAIGAELRAAFALTDKRLRAALSAPPENAP